MSTGFETRTALGGVVVTFVVGAGVEDVLVRGCCLAVDRKLARPQPEPLRRRVAALHVTILRQILSKGTFAMPKVVTDNRVGDGAFAEEARQAPMVVKCSLLGKLRPTNARYG